MLFRVLFAIALVFPLTAATPMTTLTIHVTNKRGKPIENANVVVKFQKGRSVIKLGKKMITEWELRTNREGSVSIPPIPQGNILIQVIAEDYQTFGEVENIKEENKTVEVVLNAPQQQYSAH